MWRDWGFMLESPCPLLLCVHGGDGVCYVDILGGFNGVLCGVELWFLFRVYVFL